MADPVRAVILAAGKGTRMKSARPKVLHPLAGRPLILHVVASATLATGQKPVVIVDPSTPEVAETIGALADCVPQAEQRGTGDALRSVPEEMRSAGPVLVLSGDVPLVRTETLQAMLEVYESQEADCVLLTTEADRSKGLGRIVRDADGCVIEIMEMKDWSETKAASSFEVNSGSYVFRGDVLWPRLNQLTTNNAQGEYYLTDVVAKFRSRNIATVRAPYEEVMGINDRVQLAQAEAALRRRICEMHMLAGVTIQDPATTYIDSDVEIGRDTTIHPMTVLRGRTVIGSDCEIGPMAQLRDVRTGKRVRIAASVLEESVLKDDIEIGYFNRVRPGSTLESFVSLGTHAEVKNSYIGRHSAVSHSSCVLDSELGAYVNIGAGTVTCNYDGAEKHRTVIDDHVFVGSNTTLVAPVHIEREAYIGAGSFVNNDVPEGALAVGRAKQSNISGWSERRKKAVATQ